MNQRNHPDADPADATAPTLPSEDIARYLELFASQVAVSARDSEEPVATLSHSMQAIAKNVEAILAAARGTHPGEVSDAARAQIERQCALMLERVQLAVVAFQFQDLLSQRLRHVREGLVELARAFQDPLHHGSADSLQSIGERIRGRCNLHEQRTLFDAVVNGITAAGPAAADTHESDERDRVELF